MAGRAAVLVALGEDGVVLEDEQAGVRVRVEEGVEHLVELRIRRGALELARCDSALHAAGGMEFVHAAPDVDELGIGVGGGNSKDWERQKQNC